MSKNFTSERIVKTILVLSALNIVLIAGLSFFVFQFLEMNRPRTGVDYNIDKKTDEVIKFPVQPEIKLPEVIYNLSGKITKIEKDAVTFDAAISVKNPAGEIVSDAEPRRAIVGPATNIKKLTFVKNSPVESMINFADLRVGDYIEVISSQDINTATEFTATQIMILP